MSLHRILTAVLVVAALALGAAACSDEPAPASSGSGTDGGSAPDGLLSKDTLPTESGYSWEIAQYPGIDPIPVELTVAGPWTLTPGADWPVGTTEIVAPDDVPGIDGFRDFDFVEKTADASGEHYFPRRATDEWLLQIGSITVDDSGTTAEPYAEPMKVWPLGFEVGDSFVVLDGENFRIDATVLAQNTAIVPAGEIEGAYLVRFEFVPLTEGSISGTQYYILAPGVGFVAVFGVSSGDEAIGFTALDSARVLVSLPAKR